MGDVFKFADRRLPDSRRLCGFKHLPWSARRMVRSLACEGHLVVGSDQSGVSRRTFLQGMVVTGLASQATPPAPNPAGAFRPNIVYIHSHDSGRYLQPFGQLAPTPNLARLAQEGTLFRQAFSAAPTCSPSRSA